MTGINEMDDLTVYCVYWGDKYPKAYVYALKEMVEKHLTIEHEFVCITTDTFEGIQTRLPFVSYSGWWQKIGLFAPHIATGQSLYFDLDVIITGNIDYLAEYTNHQFAAPANWARSGHGGIQSSVMAWSGNWTEPFDRFDYPKDSKRLYGDQEFLWEMLGDKWFPIPHVGSYKYHCRQEVPDDLKVIVFHGKPDPHEVTDPCILQYTSTLLSLIKSNTAIGGEKVLSATG